MFFRILFDSLARRRRRNSIAIGALAVASATWTLVLAIGTGLGDRERLDLTTYGANIIVRPQAADVVPSIAGAALPAPPAGQTLPGNSLSALGGIFWKNNLTATAPALEFECRSGAKTVAAEGVDFAPRSDAVACSLGIRGAHPAWQLAEGRWPASEATSEAVAGSRLATSHNWKPGIEIPISGPGGATTVLLTGIVRTGEREDTSLLVPLLLAQRLARVPDRISRIDVVALTSPESEALRRLHRDPKTLPPAEYDRWYCTPYATSIARQIEEASPGARADIIRRVTRAEERAAEIARTLLLFGGLAAMAAAFLAVFSTLHDSVTERVGEIGLWKALGAEPAKVATVFFAEAGVAGVIGGALGALAGIAAAPAAARLVFGFSVGRNPGLLGVSLLSTVVLSLAASVRPVARALTLEPIAALREASSGS